MLTFTSSSVRQRERPSSSDQDQSSGGGPLRSQFSQDTQYAQIFQNTYPTSPSGPSSTFGHQPATHNTPFTAFSLPVLDSGNTSFQGVQHPDTTDSGYPHLWGASSQDAELYYNNIRRLPRVNTEVAQYPYWPDSTLPVDHSLFTYPTGSAGTSSSRQLSPRFLPSPMQTDMSYSSPSSGHQLSPDFPVGSPYTAPSSTMSENHPLQTVPDSLILPLTSATETALRFKDIPGFAPSTSYTGPFVPQKMYKPPTNSDRLRYVEQVELEPPIFFEASHPDEYGIPLSDALHCRVKRLTNRDETVFQERGPSISIRLEWPCYRPWSRQIPTRDFKSPPGPITRAKLAKNIAKNVERFIQEKSRSPLEDDSDAQWRVGPNAIKLDDLVLVSLHHVSRGSWQPHLRLRRPF